MPLMLIFYRYIIGPPGIWKKRLKITMCGVSTNRRCRRSLQIFTYSNSLIFEQYPYLFSVFFLHSTWQMIMKSFARCLSAVYERMRRVDECSTGIVSMSCSTEGRSFQLMLFSFNVVDFWNVTATLNGGVL